ncbi:hypothetical protein BH09PLA1_BH09PLA1_17910 [soil metagenome]
MPRPRLDYYAAAPQRPAPRLSKLAIIAITASLVEAMLLCGPVLPFIRRTFPASLQTLAIFSMPIGTLLISVIALLRIIFSLDTLRGEGLAITGIVASMVVGLIVLILNV